MDFFAANANALVISSTETHIMIKNIDCYQLQETLFIRMQVKYVIAMVKMIHA